MPEVNPHSHSWVTISNCYNGYHISQWCSLCGTIRVDDNPTMYNEQHTFTTYEVDSITIYEVGSATGFVEHKS